jgi:hypothetical protein
VVWRAETVVPPCGQFIEVAGARIHYIDQAQGPAIVMIHGLGGQLQLELRSEERPMPLRSIKLKLVVPRANLNANDRLGLADAQ